jgi:hypothetical protein
MTVLISPSMLGIASVEVNCRLNWTLGMEVNSHTWCTFCSTHNEYSCLRHCEEESSHRFQRLIDAPLLSVDDPSLHKERRSAKLRGAKSNFTFNVSSYTRLHSTIFKLCQFEKQREEQHLQSLTRGNMAVRAQFENSNE